MGFFDNYPDFFKTSETGSYPNTLNNRYLALIEFNKGIIRNSSILDLGSHDGRWSFAALKNGASKVFGIEGKDHLVKNSHTNMEKYGIPKEQYSFIMGDVFEEIKKIEPNTINVVFCFGLFSHIMNHMELFFEIRRLGANYLILDTAISTSDKPIIELVEEDSGMEASALKTKYAASKQVLVGYPSKSALELMLTNIGFSFYYYDWHKVGIENWEHIDEYYQNKRISLVAKSNRLKTS